MTEKQKRAVWFIGQELGVKPAENENIGVFIGMHLPAARRSAWARNQVRLDAMKPVATTFELSGRTAARESAADAATEYACQAHPAAWDPYRR